jgi:hypothetical protein
MEKHESAVDLVALEGRIPVLVAKAADIGLAFGDGLHDAFRTVLHGFGQLDIARAARVLYVGMATLVGRAVLRSLWACRDLPIYTHSDVSGAGGVTNSIFGRASPPRRVLMLNG